MNDLGPQVAQQCDQQGKLLHAASFAPTILPYPSAWLGHIPFAAWIIQEVAPQTFVELGTHHGHSYFAFCQAVVEARLRTQCFAVDTWGGDPQTGYYGEEVFARAKTHNERNYKHFSRFLRMPFDDAVAHFADGSIDLLHIDGLHSYEAVRHDFETWLPKLAPGAVVLLHDTAMRAPGFGVHRFWGELIDSYPRHIEFQHACGLGVLQIGGGPICANLKWLMQDAHERVDVLRYFEALGARQEERFALDSLRNHSKGLEDEIERLRAEVGGHKSALDLADVRITNLVERERNKDATISTLRQEIERQEAHIRALYTSTSWRLTQPLREMRAWLARIRDVGTHAIIWVRGRGGLQKAIRVTISTYRAHGLKGLRAKARSAVRKGCSGPVPGSDGNDRNDYAAWLTKYDCGTDEWRRAMRRDIEFFDRPPLVSVIMPTYNSNHKWLREAIASVQAQVYPYWELCIADDASTDPAVREILRDYAKSDARIKVVFRAENGHISVASNSALDIASGDWIALLDHDDRLHESALYWVAKEIMAEPECAIVYSDEDKIDIDGRRRDPYWKCEWNRDLFYSHNMISHLGVYRNDIVKKVGAFREGFEGAQDYDLALRCSEQVAPGQIRHIPRVLYHWRIHAGSTSQSSQAKPYAAVAGERALDEHLVRRGLKASARWIEYGYRVEYEIAKPCPMVSVIIPTRDRVDLLRKCVNSVLTRTAYELYEIVVVDNGSIERSTREFLDEIGENPKVRVVRDASPFNFSALNNRAVALADGDIIALLNSDIEVISPEWLCEMVSLAVQEDVGAVGARLWYPDETLQHGGVILGIAGVAGHSHRYLPRFNAGFFGRASLRQSLSAVTGACLVVRKTVYQEVGGLNERDLAIAFNDVDFCLRIRNAGYRNVWSPYAELYHHESASRGADTETDKRIRLVGETAFMKSQWGGLLMQDPAYSPNLTLDFEDFSLAWPPRIALVPEEVLRDRYQGKSRDSVG